MIRFSPFPLALLAAAGWSALAPAQVADPYSIALENPSAGTTMRRAVSGDFDGDFRRDVVVLVDGLPTVLWAPSIYGWSAELTEIGAVNDVDAVTGTPDALVTVSHGDLEEWTYQTSTQTFTSTTLDASSTWINAKAVRAADLDGIAPIDFIGISSSGLAVVTLTRNGSTSTAATIALNPISPALRTLESVRWLSNGLDQIAVATDKELMIVDSVSGLLTSFATGGGTSPALAAVELAGVAQEGVAWGREVSVGANHVSLHKHSSLGPAEPVRNLTYYTPRGLACGDTDGDGDGDLFCAGSFSAYGLFMGQVPPTPAGSDSSWSVTWPDSVAIPLSTGAVAGSSPGVIITDLDGDGDNDALSTVDTGVLVTIQNGWYKSETAYQLFVPAPPPTGFAYLPGEHLYESEVTLPIENLPLYGNYIEVSVRRELDPSASEVTYDPIPRAAQYYDLTGHDRASAFPADVELGIVLDQPEGEDEYIAIQVRMVERLPASGVVTSAGHEYAFILVVHDGVGNKAGQGELPPVRPVGGGTPPPGGG